MWKMKMKTLSQKNLVESLLSDQRDRFLATIEKLEEKGLKNPLTLEEIGEFGKACGSHHEITTILNSINNEKD